MREIAKDNGIPLADVNRALDLFTESTFNDKVREHTLALELAHLDELQEVFYKQSLSGDVQSAQLVSKLIESDVASSWACTRRSKPSCR